ncbi:hypothetical protein VCHA37P202_70095 [Vibrio chagasii]|nr:hypothetical protein VCHA37P202_70095 [Vibrio chagasii]
MISTKFVEVLISILTIRAND